MIKGIRYIYKDICESYEDHLILKDNPSKMLTSTMWKALFLGFLGCFLILKAQGIDFFLLVDCVLSHSYWLVLSSSIHGHYPWRKGTGS